MPNIDIHADFPPNPTVKRGDKIIEYWDGWSSKHINGECVLIRTRNFLDEVKTVFDPENLPYHFIKQEPEHALV